MTIAGVNIQDDYSGQISLINLTYQYCQAVPAIHLQLNKDQLNFSWI